MHDYKELAAQEAAHEAQDQEAVTTLDNAVAIVVEMIRDKSKRGTKPIPNLSAMQWWQVRKILDTEV